MTFFSNIPIYIRIIGLVSLIAFYLYPFPITYFYHIAILPNGIFLLAFIYSQYKIRKIDGHRAYFRIFACLFSCIISIKNVILFLYYWEELNACPQLIIGSIVGCLPLIILILGVIVFFTIIKPLSDKKLGKQIKELEAKLSSVPPPDSSKDRG